MFLPEKYERSDTDILWLTFKFRFYTSFTANRRVDIEERLAYETQLCRFEWNESLLADLDQCRTQKFCKNFNLKNSTFCRFNFIDYAHAFLLPCLMRTFSTDPPKSSTFLQRMADVSMRLGWTCDASSLTPPMPTTDRPRLVNSPRTTPKLEMGSLTAFWSSRKWPPAYCKPVKTFQCYLILGNIFIYTKSQKKSCKKFVLYRLSLN